MEDEQRVTEARARKRKGVEDSEEQHWESMMGFLGAISDGPSDVRRIQAIRESVYGDGISAGRINVVGANTYSVLGEKIKVLTKDELPAGFAKKYPDHDVIDGLYVFPVEQ